ncbi:hypothetical protein Bb109J_c1664 [Bdellovibrio bacteriovorus]|uniref:DUF962 domain-containing protein n=1 Tax=Bdellovibrio bacteriovorus TaxID=959 RepID=UPI000A5FDCCC|nr:DUF962 domain-containing protein [Bdellovibrio bacteriovorus]BEV68244.1 hypothetical protein Bb109J_c1664 [Bdellovibrio bacteriovorus]
MKSFQEFWPFYLQEHSNPFNRRLHFVGTLLVHLLIVAALLTEQWSLLWGLPVIGYGFAWVGHFVVEKNRPATFKHPLWSLRGDFKMFYQMCAGKLWS